MKRLPLFKKNLLRIEGVRHEALNVARGRIILMSIGFVFLYILLAARLFDVSVIQARPHIVGQDLAAMPQGALSLMRADVVDRNGVLLATSLETASLYADPSLVLNAPQTASALAALFPDMEERVILERLTRSGRFAWVRRNLTPDEQYHVLKIGEPGLAFQTERRRIYPQGGMFAHLVGYADIDGRGLAGVERSFDARLEAGGDPLALSVDVRLQHIVKRELSRAMKEFEAIGGAGAIMDVASGEILAAVSLPDFDPHQLNDQRDARFNRFTLGTYELGSVFKIFSTALYLEDTNAQMQELLDARKPLKVGRHRITDFHPQKRQLTIPESFMVSSNIASGLMAQEIGNERMQSFYKDLGLMDKIEIGINEVAAPQLPPRWRDINTITASYGHGIAVTPMHVLAAGASIVNGGYPVQPRLTLERGAGAEGSAKVSRIKPEIRIISPQTAHNMRRLLRLVVAQGTGRNADVKGYRVGGKTGTAEKIVNGRYKKDELISTFVGFFPMDAPRYAILVMVDEPKGQKHSFGFATAGWVAAPAAGRIIGAMAPLLGIAPQTLSEGEDIADSLKQYVKNDEQIKAQRLGEVSVETTSF